MNQNTSHAVMAQRAEPNDSLDFFPTPPWATRALCGALMETGDLKAMSCWEPACGEGHMARPLAEYFGQVRASDVHDYGLGEVLDFLYGDYAGLQVPHNRLLYPFPADAAKPDWIITNPPFRLGREFAITALRRARRGVALLVRTAFLEGGERFETLFSQHRPSAVFQFCERVPMVKGRYDPKASTATSYCWIVWTVDETIPPGNCFTAFRWIPPCRAHLERASDFEAAA
jgi:hypothetical protein